MCGFLGEGYGTGAAKDRRKRSLSRFPPISKDPLPWYTLTNTASDSYRTSVTSSPTDFSPYVRRNSKLDSAASLKPNCHRSLPESVRNIAAKHADSVKEWRPGASEALQRPLGRLPAPLRVHGISESLLLKKNRKKYEIPCTRSGAGRRPNGRCKTFRKRLAAIP